MRDFPLQLVCLTVAAAGLMAADPVWKGKPPATWSEQEAKDLLTSSPWTKQVTAVITRRLTEDQLREGGQMGQPTGVGNDGIDPKGSGPKVSPNILSGRGGEDRSPRSMARPIKLSLRWESALPVQLAELRAHESEPPTLDGDGYRYRIAVYGIPNPGFKGDPKQLGQPLKSLAALKRDGKKDVKPVNVEVFQRENDVVVVYVFPLSAEISKKDLHVQFEAHIGRIVLSQDFDLSAMEFAGKLEI
jgi:hypothetical protein